MPKHPPNSVNKVCPECGELMIGDGNNEWGVCILCLNWIREQEEMRKYRKFIYELETNGGKR